MDRAKTVFNILTAYWKFVKPYSEKLPTTDEEWETLVRDNAKLTKEFVTDSDGKDSERQFAREIAVACLNYLQNRSKEHES